MAHSSAPRRGSALALVAAALLVPLVLLQLLSWRLESAQGLLRYLDAHRPPRASVALSTHMQAQLFHAFVLSRDPRNAARAIPIVGSSSVVNSVDVGAIDPRLRGAGLHAENFGMAGLGAYELPMLKGDLLAPGRRAVVFAYNPWMFRRSAYREALLRRWNTREAVGLFTFDDFEASDLTRYATGALAELFPAFRYNEFLKAQALRWLTGTLSPLESPYDFPDDPPETMSAAAGPLDPMLRRWYVESDTDGDSLGWRGLARFLQLARAAQVPVLVVPVPLMPADRDRYLRGIDVPQIDRRVRELAALQHALFVERRDLPVFPAAAFRDPVHLNSTGRAAYSSWLGATIEHRLLPAVLRDGL